MIDEEYDAGHNVENNISDGAVKNDAEVVFEPPAQPQPTLHQDLLDSIQAVKDKLRARLPVKITLIKIEVSELPKVHRFIRNKPWIKSQYGVNYSWSADYIEDEFGDHALWNELNWSFTIERNQRDRQDLVIAVCSKDLIIGRYILSREEISDLAESAIANHLKKEVKGKDQDDGDAEDFISIEGEVINAIGSAGRIHILCSRKVQEGFLPDINEMANANAQSNSVILDNPARSPRPGSPSFDNFVPLFSYHEVTVRLLAVAVMDLHAAHYFQSNSPTVCVDVGSYVNITDSKPNAGMSARWTDLFWRFTVSRDHGMIVTVVSNSVLIGKCMFATEELLSVAPNSKGVISIIKLLSNGRELTGKIKISIIINHPEDLFAPATSLNKDLRESVYPKDRPDVDRSIPNDIIRRDHSNLSPDGAEEEAAPSEEQKGDVRLSSPSNTAKDAEYEGTFIRPQSPNSSAVLDLIPMQMRIKQLPFTIVVQEVTVLDIKWPSLLNFWLPGTSKYLRLHLGCGSFAFSTSDMRTNGRFAHWLDIVWKVPVIADANCLRITLWSHSTNLGEAKLNVRDLLGMPTTKTGRTEIFAKICNETNEVTGRVRIACHYERGNTVQPDSNVHRVNGAITTLKSYSSPNSSPAKTRNTLHSASSPNLSLSGQIAKENLIAQSMANSSYLSITKTLVSPEEPLILGFPLLVHVKSITLVDVVVGNRSSILFRPSILVQMICDRKQAVTDEVKPIGGAAKFEGMEWKLHVRKDSNLVVVVKTKQNFIVGKAEISTEKLLSQPLLAEGTVQVSVLLRREGVTSGKAILFLGLNNLELPPEAENCILDARNTGEMGSGADSMMRSQVQSAILNHNSPPQMYVNDSHAQIMQLVDSSNQLPRMPWNNASVDDSLEDQSRLNNITLGSVRSPVANRSVAGTAISPVFDPSILQVPDKKKKQFFDFHIGIYEVDLWDLTMVSTGQSNSFMVAAACGKWATSTSTQETNGNACFWTGLNWECHILDSQTKFRLTIHVRNRIVGTAFFNIDQLMNASTDNTGYKRVQGLVVDGQRHGVGKVKISYVVDVQKKMVLNQLNSFATPMNPKRSSENRLQQSMSTSKFPDQMPSFVQSLSAEDHMIGSGLELDEDSFAPQIEFPCTFVLCELAAMELMPAHAVGRNIPSIRVQCGNFYQVTQKNMDGLELCSFNDLNWAFPVDVNSTIAFNIVSKDTAQIGSVELEVARMANIPPNLRGFRETMLLVKRNGMSAGKLVVRAKLSPLLDTYHENIPSASPSIRENTAPFMLPPIGQSSLQSVAYSSEEQQQMNNLQHNSSLGSSNSYYSSNIYASRKYSTKGGSTKQPTSTSMPLLQISSGAPAYSHGVPSNVMIIPSVRTGAGNVVGNNFIQSQPSSPLARTSTKSMRSPAASNMDYLQIIDRSDRAVVNKEPMPYPDPNTGSYRYDPPQSQNSLQYTGPNTGSYRFDPSKIHNSVQYPNPSAGSYRYDPPQSQKSVQYTGPNTGSYRYDPVYSHNIVDTADDMSYLGSLSVNSKTSRNRTNSRDQDMAAGNDSPVGGSAINSRGFSPRMAGNSISASLANQSQGSLHMADNFSEPISVQIHSVHTAEMKSAHSFALNSPICALACGKFTLTTPAIPSAGSSATWDNINFSFSFDKKSNFRVLFVSNDVGIGYCNFSREKLLNGKPSQTGLVVVGDMVDQAGKLAGKVKVVYSIEVPL